MQLPFTAVEKSHMIGRFVGGKEKDQKFSFKLDKVKIPIENLRPDR